MAFKEKTDRNEYISGFLKEKYSRFTVNLEKEKDKDILEHLNKIRSSDITMVDYIRNLIREDMKKERG